MDPKEFAKVVVQNGFSPFTGVPCSVFKHLLNYVEDAKEADYYTATSEGEAMGLAGGFALAGKIPVVLMQVDGYGNAVNPLSSLQLLYKLPCLLLISWRGEPDKKDAPQHEVMGNCIMDLLTVFKIPYAIPGADRESLVRSLQAAQKHISSSSTPYSLLIRKDFFQPYEKKAVTAISDLHLRHEYISLIGSHSGEEDIFIGSTGFCGREMHSILNDKKNFYMMGSMGCALSIGLALSIERPNRKVFVLDGDGALLMKMGTMATVGAIRPANLHHVCFDNQQYESTGGQKTVSDCIDLPKVAGALGYRSAATFVKPSALHNFLQTIPNNFGPHFIHVRIRPGTIPDLARPAESPIEMKKRFSADIAESQRIDPFLIGDTCETG